MLLKNIFLLFLGLACISCATNYSDLGFSESEWNNLTKKEQQQIIKKSKKLNWTHQQYTKHNVPMSLRFRNIEIDFLKGTTNFSNNAKSFQPTKIKISENTCDSVKIVSTSNQIKYLKICYKNYRLSIDPSPWQEDYQYGSVLIYSNNLWKRGFKYTNLNTKGKTKIKNLSIFIRSV